MGIGGGDLPNVRIDPQNPDIIYSASVVCWKSVDGGKTWSAWKGAPGGDDYQNVWINPSNSEIILLASDQGAIVTVNGGETWSSWYNQSTAQLYHVSADNAFPYRLLSGQQESGSVSIASRGDNGAITFRDWQPVGAEEYGYVVADPLDPDIVIGGKLTRYDRRTGQAQNILPQPLRPAGYRMLRTQPIVYAPRDPQLLFFGANTLWQTRDRGDTWEQISPDLTRKTYALPASIGKYKDEPTAEAKQRGVIYTIAPSPLDVKRIWIGTDDGLIQRTLDGGKTWADVTPPAITAWQKVSLIEAGHFDAGTAYAAINTLRVDDNRPHIYRTHDGGKTWQEIVRGIPDGQVVNVVREDPVRKGLLFAGTERAVYVSFDDGDNWEPLRLNMPATSIRDLIVKDDDLAVGTHGRGFWILDNITPLRQLGPKPTATALLQPAPAVRVRWNMNDDTPLPPDEPTGENPPEGAAIDYFLAQNATGPVTLEIKTQAGELVRRYASTDVITPPDPAKLKIPPYWVRPPAALVATPGLHRFHWDMHHTPVPGIEPEYPIAAIRGETAPEPTGPWAVPGDYTVTLSTGGKSFTQPLKLSLDPRVKVTPEDLQEQYDLSKKMAELRGKLAPISRQFDTMVEKLAEARAKTTAEPVQKAIAAVMLRLEQLTPPNARPGAPLSLGALGKVETVYSALQGADAVPTPTLRDAANVAEELALTATGVWRDLLAEDLPVLNQALQGAGLPAIEMQATAP